MTFKRDIKSDIFETNKIIINSPNQFYTGKSWLGHSKCCGKIDYELLQGATIAELVQSSGRNMRGVTAHFNHLKTTHGLSITNKNGVYKFEYIHSK
jgi:hypothetical protein